MPRQKLVIYFFTFLAALGLGMYLLLPPDSELRLLGIVLLIFCAPMVLRSLLRQIKVRVPAPRPVERPIASVPREVNLMLEATFSRIVATALMRVDRADGNILDLPCLLALGSDGFSTRLWRADKIGGPWPSGEALVLNAEFLMPERALSHFPVGTIAHVLVDNKVIGSVKILRNHANENVALASPV
jgi:hypothetical protein